MDIKEAKSFVESLRMRDSSLKKENTLFLYCSQFYSLEEVKLSMKIENTKESLVKPIVICHVEDEAKVLYELWKKYTTEKERLLIRDSTRRSLPRDRRVKMPIKPKSMLFISRQRNKPQLLADTLAKLLDQHHDYIIGMGHFVSKYPHAGCEKLATVCEMFSNTIKDIANDNIFIDDTAKDYRDERVVRFVMNEDIDIIFIDEFVWSDEKTK